jgi:putative DNA primase/helicase
VSDVLDSLRAVCNLPASSAAPCWLANDPGLNPVEILACRNGLLYIPTRQLVPATPNFFTLNGLEFDYDPDAPPPYEWLNFLDQLWPEDSESRDTLQEWIGYLLTPETRLQKMLMVIGPKRAGKGTIGRVTRMLLGDRNVCAPTLASAGQQFGLSVLVGKTAAIIADARISGRADTAVITEKLLSISGEDPQTIPRKFLPDWNGSLPTRFMLMTNELPKIEDASGTLAFHHSDAHQILLWT